MQDKREDFRGRSAIGRGTAAFALALGLIVTTPGPRTIAADLHTFWDSRCASCHRHAGEFARNHFKLKDGRLVGRNPARDICAYLVGHGAGDAMAAPVCAMLTAQAATPALFKDKCARCHDSAADLARTGLVTGEGGALKGKINGRELSGFLATHSELEAGEIRMLVETLRRVSKEVGAMAAE